MKHRIFFLMITLYLNNGAASQDIFSHDSVMATMKRVADYRCTSNLESSWVTSPYFAGLLALYNRSNDRRYLDTAIAWSSRFNWQVSGGDSTSNDGNSQCCFQTYCEIYLLDTLPQNQYMYLPARNNLARMFDAAALPDRRWWCCDLQFMAAPSIVRCARAAKEPRLIDSMNAYWWNSSAAYYDTVDHLYYRDNGFADSAKTTGRKIFWSRGNGWVFAALARIIPFLPDNYPSRPAFIAQFRAMATRLRQLQQPDGLWRADLLNPEAFPQPETSGSAFFCFGMAWGVNTGILDASEYGAVARSAWIALTGKIRPDGSLGWVQPWNDEPASTEATNTQPFGEGAFLLAGAEIDKMVAVELIAPQRHIRSGSMKTPGWRLLISTEGSHVPAQGYDPSGRLFRLPQTGTIAGVRVIITTK